ncbi:hypothetical protein EVA_19259 [gut metagenome]|uniref:Uncharacterized protein n=1 Tax=gut metagenome TaxID=749906 RepID=J9FZ78_9ZZZZ
MRIFLRYSEYSLSEYFLPSSFSRSSFSITYGGVGIPEGSCGPAPRTSYPFWASPL